MNNIENRIERLEQLASGAPTPESDEPLSAQEEYKRLVNSPLSRRKRDTAVATMTPEEAYRMMIASDNDS